MTYTTTIVNKRLRVSGPNFFDGDLSPREFDKRNQEVYDGIDFSAIEEVVNTMLPEGYYCKIED